MSLLPVVFLWLAFSVQAEPPPTGTVLTNFARLTYTAAPDGLETTVNVTTVSGLGADEEQPPTDISLTCSVPGCTGPLIIENRPGQLIGSLTVLDPNLDDSHELVLGIDDDLVFEIVGDQLKLLDGLSLDFETGVTSINVTVTATDPSGFSIDRVLAIEIRDVNEAPFDLASSNEFVIAGSTERRIGQLSAVDTDADENLIFTVVDDDRFTVLEGNVLGLAQGVTLDENVTIPVTVQVADKGGLTTTRIFEISTDPTTNPPSASDPIIILMSPNASGSDVSIPEAVCSPPSGAVPGSGVTELRVNLGLGDVPGDKSLSEAVAYAIGEPIIVSVADAEANLQPFEIDRIEVLLEIDGTGDSELLTLLETDLDTGVFVSFVFTTSQTSVSNDCILTVASRNQVDATYTNTIGKKSVATLAQIAPVGIIFNAVTGVPIDGVIMAILDVATGEPAPIFGDGPEFAPYPSTIVSGETIEDAAGAIYQNGPGEYRFPALADGRYRLEIVNDEGWGFSELPDSAIQSVGIQRGLTTTSSGKFTLTDASRGVEFTVSQGALPRIDIPIEQAQRVSQPVEKTPSTIEFLQYSSIAEVGAPTNVAQTYCVSGTTRSVSELKNVAVPVPGVVNLVPAKTFKAGQPVFVRVTDADQNVDPESRERITILLDVPASGDREFLQLTETENNSGVFIGYVQSVQNQRDVGNCELGVVKDATIKTRYADVFDADDFSESLVLVDPFGRIFSTKDGRLIDGVSVTLIDTATGQPAEVFGDGPTFAAYPNPVVSGSQVVDAAGLIYNFPDGEYRFPFVSPGFYQLQFEDLPAELIFPSTVTEASIQSLPGAPFEVATGSFGEEFEVPIGPALHIDVPVDEPLGEMFVAKTASKDLAAIGDFVQYRLTVQNNFNAAVSNTQLQDTLPKGFRYQLGSLRIGGSKVPDPAISLDGRILMIDLPSVGAATINVSYVTEITPGANVGEAVNVATVIGDLVSSSNTATSRIMVGNDLFSDKAFLVGSVTLQQCEADDVSDAETASEQIGLEGVRLYLEDGSYVVTDDKGSWHMEGIEAGTHIVQLDVDSLDDRYEVSPCNDNTRFAGSAHSQFVDVKGGTLWRADFKVQEKAPPESLIELSQALKVDGEGVWVSIKTENIGPVLLSNAKLIYRVPKGWQIVKGTEKLDGKPTTHSQTVVGSVYALDSLADVTELRMKIEPKLIQEVVQPTNQLAAFRPRFSSRRARLNSEDIAELEAMISEWQGVKWQQITVVGHTDDVPIAAENLLEFNDNQALSTARAESVAAYLAGRVDVEHLVVVGAGEQYPIATNTTKNGRRQNRRVEFLLLPAPVPRQRVVNAEVLNGESSARLSFSSAGSAKGKTAMNKLPLNRLVGGFENLTTTVTGTAIGTWDLAGEEIRDELIARAADVQGFISIKDGARLGRPVHAVKVDLDSRLKPRLTLDGVQIGRDRIGFSMTDEETGKSIYSYIGVNLGEPGLHELKLEGIGPFGNARFTETLQIVRVGELYNIDFESAEGNIADGRTPVKVKLRLTDRQGEELGIPHVLLLDGGDLQRFDQNFTLSELSLIEDRKEVSVKSDGTLLFNPVSTSGLYRATLKYDDTEEDIEVFVAPEKRDWIMVGLAEGSVAYNNISGNMQNLAEAGLGEDVETDGRIAFYAKGQVKGEFLLTIAYDTDKERKDALQQTIDPNSFYTLYGDRTQTQYDAASQEKLFLKLEKDQFYALYGDFSTGLNGGELVQYSRSLTGLKSEYEGDNFEVVVFASEADQAFIKDEIRGDGTSGLYRLTTPGLVTNSEKIVLETRDRFHSEEIVDTIELTRHLDYNIDYVAGTLFFKQPIFSQDPAFNPIFIVADYEVDGRGTDELNTGGRVAYKPNEDIEVGLTLVKEGTERREGELAGVDLLYQVDDETEIKAEIAATRSKVDGVESDGTAYILEATRRTDKIDAMAYVREQRGGFGLGQQNSSETGTRKVGVQANYTIAEGIEVAGEVYRQSDLVTDTDLDVATTSVQMQGDKYTLNSGVRSAKSVREGETQVSNQLLMGGNYRVLDGKLILNAAAETPIAGKGEAGDFPKRLRVGLDYKLTDNITLKAEQEFTWGDELDTQGTRIGMSTQLWEGGELVTSVEQKDEENAQRLAAVAGLKQRWDLNENWSFDFGVDRSQTIKQVSKAPPPLTVTTVFSSPSNDDFTSVTFGSKFRQDAWDWATRVEYREADSEDKINLLSDVIRNLEDGQQLLAKLDVQRSEGDDSDQTQAGIQLGYSYRPDDSRWTVFNRLDLRHSQAQSAGFDQRSQKIVNNLNANYLWSDDTQVALQYGLKYVVDNFDEDEYRGFTDLYGMEVRHGLNNRWDVGFQGSMYNSRGADVSDYSYGVSFGYNMARNVWVSLGYNFDGFQDDDFSASEYTSEGLFLKYRLKFDQNTANSILGLMD